MNNFNLTLAGQCASTPLPGLLSHSQQKFEQIESRTALIIPLLVLIYLEKSAKRMVVKGQEVKVCLCKGGSLSAELFFSDGDILKHQQESTERRS